MNKSYIEKKPIKNYQSLSDFENINNIKKELVLFI